MLPKRSASLSNHGEYITLNGVRIKLKKHPTDFTVLGHSEILSKQNKGKSKNISSNMTRISTADYQECEQLLSEARQDSVAHHVYQVEGTGEEIIITDRILLNLRHQDTKELEKIIKEFHLHLESRMGDTYILRITAQTGRNPLKVANEIAKREEVTACSPELLLEQKLY